MCNFKFYKHSRADIKVVKIRGRFLNEYESTFQFIRASKSTEKILSEIRIEFFAVDRL